MRSRGPQRALRLSFRARVEAVPPVRRRVSAYLREGGCNPRFTDEFVLALDELCNNAVEHGAHAGEQLVLTLSHDSNKRCTSGILRASSAISARELDALTTTSSLPDLESERGRGLFLFRAMVDEFEVHDLERGVVEMRFRKNW